MLCVGVWRAVESRLMTKWSDAVKYEQLYLETVKGSDDEAKEIMITESSTRLKEYNQKLMMQMSMRSILG